MIQCRGAGLDSATVLCIAHRRRRLAGKSGAGATSAVLLCLVLVVSGCSRPPLESDYGKRDLKTVDGTGVLASMFEQAGHKVGSWRRLSPKLSRCDTIVWAPASYSPPSLEVREYLEGWLSEESGRTLIYVGRDFDPVPGYWQRMAAVMPAAQRLEVDQNLAKALLDRQTSRQTVSTDSYARWFVQRQSWVEGPVRSIGGRWAESLDASQAELRLGHRLESPRISDIPPPPTIAPGAPTPAQVRKIPPFLRRLIQQPQAELRSLPTQFEVLLTADGQPFVTRVTDEEWDESRILVVANGSFLMNMPLVNPVHRQWAGKLIDECGSPGRVIFLETDELGATIHERDSGGGAVTKIEFLSTWPSFIVMLHVLAMGLIYCAKVFPIFGRARELPETSPSDFGKHIEALGSLLEKTEDLEFARQRIAFYHQHVRR
ncbi:MAG: hypothetical protein FJ295_17535 [Planctomycetes bacterium]|nr:hypothetical protein [Planctomycetota bacterium]